MGEDGSSYGIVSLHEALNIARSKGLDIMEVSPNASPPVVKILDYGKYKYEMQKKASENKKKHSVIQLKEMQFRMNIEQHDLEIKIKKIKEFLVRGDKVRLSMQFWGRENSFKDQGLEKFASIMKVLEDFGATIEAPAKLVGNRITAVVASNKKVTGLQTK